MFSCMKHMWLAMNVTITYLKEFESWIGHSESPWERKKHLRDNDGNYKEHLLRDLYPQTSQEQWDNFVAWSKSDEFQIMLLLKTYYF
jgi:hypothetical protein